MVIRKDKLEARNSLLGRSLDGLSVSASMEVVDHDVVKKELLNLLKKSIKRRYSYSQLCKSLQQFGDNRLRGTVFLGESVNQSVCQSASVLEYILSSPDLSALFDLFADSMLPVLYTVYTMALSENNEMEREEFVQNLASLVPAQAPKWDKYVASLLEFRNYVAERSDSLELDEKICLEKKVLPNSFGTDVLVDDSNSVIEAINLVPYGTDIKAYLNWSECYEQQEGNLMNYLLRNEEKLIGKCVLLSNGAVLRIRDYLRVMESFAGSTVAEIACYLLEFVLHKPSSLETLVNTFERYLEEQYPTLDTRIQLCIEILMNFPSDLLRAWFMRNIILRCLGDIDRNVLSAFSSKFNDSLCLSKIGKLLDVPSLLSPTNHLMPSYKM